MNNESTAAVAPRLSFLSLAIGLACSPSLLAQQETRLAHILVTEEMVRGTGKSLDKQILDAFRFANSDTATLLRNTPGISFYTGGGASSLPVINGLGDDRLKILVDGMSITSACPNHMNPALSYIDPAAVSQLNVFAGIVPVSQGGDNIGGSINVKSTPPVFANPGEGVKTAGNFAAFHRSNGSINGASLYTLAATERLSFSYSANTVNAGNYQDGQGQKVAASGYNVRNNALKLAALSASDLWTLALGWQDIPVQGYPNQSMDMTANNSFSINAGFSGGFVWGNLEANVFRQHVRHKMDVLADKAAAAGFPAMDSYMPMDTDAVDLGYSLLGILTINDNKILRIGNEFHRYSLDDWWPPLVGSGGMEPDTFWNVNGGTRTRLALFSELDTAFNEKLSTQIGARVEQVTMNTGAVQGYYDANSAFGDAYETDAKAFNARDLKREDLNWDLTASARFVRSATQTFDIGLSRKTRSPNLHERYTWSNEAMMAGLMNNWFGDLNSYVGNVNLEPEVAYTLKASANWHDAQQQNWHITVTPFLTQVQDYINATTNISANPYNMSGIMGRRSLSFSNQDAKLYGAEFSADKFIGKAGGDWLIRAAVDYTRGKTADDGLYNIMPLSGRLAIEHNTSTWTNTVEQVLVSTKNDVSAIRGESATAGYSLTHYRTAYAVNKFFTLNISLENIFDHDYDLPLGGLEYSTGNMMNAPKPVRAAGRSINAGVSIKF